jgi:SAM-dependent methyltransferase
MIEHLHRRIRKEQFNPGFLGVFLNPFFLARRGLWSEMRRLSTFARGRVLDVGCGTQPYRSLFEVPEYVGLDIDTPLSRARGTADAFYDGQRLPFDVARFDTVLCNQVLEHVFNPEQFVAEMGRVLVPGGRLILSVPFVWDEHEQPWDYARYTSFGLRALLEGGGFRILEQRKLLADCSVLFQLANAYLYKVLRSRHPSVNVVVNVLLMAPISLLGWLAGVLLPDNQDLFLDQAVLAEKL